MSRVTGLDRSTIVRGLPNSAATTGLLLAASAMPAPGASRSRPPSRVSRALDRLLHDATAGDPLTGLQWTHRSLRQLAKALRRRGIKVSPNTIARLMHDAGFSLRTNRKRLAEVTDPDRDRQFRYLTRLRQAVHSRGLPVISVDTKKKELVGPFKNPGRTWRRQPRGRVRRHDFSSWAIGRADPLRHLRPGLQRRSRSWSARRTRRQRSPWRPSAAGGSCDRSQALPRGAAAC